MRKLTRLFFIALLVLSACVAKLSSQQRSFVTVRGNALNNGVVVLDVEKDGKTYKLTCNHGLTSCNPLKNGTYQIVKLPKNFGMYECQDVQIFSETVVDTDKEVKLGEYCLEDK